MSYYAWIMLGVSVPAGCFGIAMIANVVAARIAYARREGGSVER